jgi:hypothetical protein
LQKPDGRHTAVLAAHPSKPGTFFAAWKDICKIERFDQVQSAHELSFVRMRRSPSNHAL